MHSKLFIIILFTSQLAAAQTDTLKAGQPLPYWKNLRPVENKFMLYTEKGGTLFPVDVVWTRKVEFITLNGEDVVMVQQKTTSKDSLQNSTKVSILKKGTLLPISHVAENFAARITTLFYSEKAELSLDSLKSGITKKLQFDLTTAGYDFEADEELFSLLPLKEKYKVAIPFYQPGTRRPTKYYTYEVVGTAFIQLPDGGKLECWKLQSQYTGGISTWWISKINQQFIQQQRVMSDGTVLHKVRLTE